MALQLGELPKFESSQSRCTTTVITLYLLLAGVLEEAKFFGIEELYSQLEGLCVTVNKPRDDLALTRRDVIDVLMATSSSASEMRFQGVNLVSIHAVWFIRDGL